MDIINMPIGDLAILTDLVRKRNQAKLDKAEEEKKKAQRKRDYSNIRNPYLRNRAKMMDMERNKSNPSPSSNFSREDLADMDDALNGM